MVSDPIPRESMKRGLVLLLKVSMSAGILSWIFTFVPVGETLSALRSSRTGLFLAAVLVTLSANGAASLRMRRLIANQGMSISAPRIFSINLVSNFYGMFLPGSLAGGAVRWHRLYLADRNGVGAFIAIVLNRFLLTTMTVALGAVYWASTGRHQSDDTVGIILFGILAGLLLLQGILVSGLASPSFRAAPGSDEGGVKGFRVRILNVLAALSRYRDLPRSELLGVAGLAVLEDLLGLASFYLMSLSAGISVPLLHLGWVRSFLILITMVPISFLGIGIQEGTLIPLLGRYGVPGPEAVAFSFLLVARAIVIAFAGGVLEARNVFFPDAGAGIPEKEDP